ncbi:MAG: hypothetical protein KF781_05145 [Chitinophagaceae bacterium]|nr:hypothetical protein [Chitinophagaceae bacterium]MCW5905905.1 hypothetical protein [Chitinophagaceae bacterium]
MKLFKHAVIFFLVTSLLLGVSITNNLSAQNVDGTSLDHGTSIDVPVFEDGTLDKNNNGTISGDPHADYDWGDDDPGGPGGGGFPPIDDIPFDGGVGVLLALGIIGGYKVSRKK